MPVYEYECNICRHYFETQVQADGSAPDRCPQCGARKITRLLSGTRMAKGAFAGICGIGGAVDRR